MPSLNCSIPLTAAPIKAQFWTDKDAPCEIISGEL